MARKIGLVAASKRRRGGIARAHDQFDPSPVFRRARDFCDRSYSEWYVLSTVVPVGATAAGDRRRRACALSAQRG